MNIVTKYTTNASGKGQMKATALGKQRTVPYDHSMNREQNFANAAAALLLDGFQFTGQGIDPTAYTFREKDNAHIFTVTVPV